MLTKNIDVSDGLVNSAFATVSGIEILPDQSGPKFINVVFNNRNVGSKQRRLLVAEAQDDNYVAIEIQEEHIGKKSTCKQFIIKYSVGQKYCCL